MFFVVSSFVIDSSFELRNSLLLKKYGVAYRGDKYPPSRATKIICRHIYTIKFEIFAVTTSRLIIHRSHEGSSSIRCRISAIILPSSAKSMQKKIDKLISASPKPWEGIIAIEMPDVMEKTATSDQAADLGAEELDGLGHRDLADGAEGLAEWAH